MNPLSLILSIPSVLSGNSPFSKRDPGMSTDSPLNNTSDLGDTQDTSTVMKSGTGTGAKGKGGINYGTGLYDPEQSARILENMQAFKNQREGSSGNMMSPLDQHLQSAIAYGTGNPEDILNIQKQSQDNAKSAFDMQMQIEQFKAGQAQQAAFNKMKDNFYKFLTGANAPSGAEGSANLGGISNIYTLPIEIQIALAGAQTKAEWDKIYNEYAKDVNVERAKNFYNIEWNKPILLGFGKGVNSTTKQMSLRDAQKYLNQPNVTIMDPSTGQQLDPTGKPIVSSNAPIYNKPAAPKFVPDPSLVPKAITEYKEGGRVQHYADGNSVFADVPPIEVADASNNVRIPAAPVVNVSPNPSKVVTRPAPIESYPTAPEEIAKNRDIRNTIETTGGNEREKEDMLDIKDLQSRATQAQSALDDVQRYEQFLNKHPNIFAPITSHPILQKVVPWLEALPGVGFVPGGKGEGGHGWDLRDAITNAQMDEKDISYRKNADALATQLGIAYAKLNFPGRMTNMELSQQQRAKGLSVDDPTTSNQLAINLIKHEAAKNLGLANAWQKFYEQEAKMGFRPTWTNFKSTDAYDHWKHLSPPKELLGDNPQNAFKTNAGHTVQKVGENSMGQYAINGTIVNLPNNFEDKSPEDQKQFIDDLVQNHTDENGNLNAPNYYPNQTKIAGAEIGVASKIVQDVGLGLTHKTIKLLNKAFSSKDPTAAAAAAKDPFAGTAAYHASNANIYNNEQEAARIKALHDAMSPAEKAKWEMSIDKTELVPKGTNEKIIAERQAAAKAAAEKVAAEEAAKTSSRSAIGKVANTPGIKSILPYAGRALSGAQLVGGVDRLYQPGWRNKAAGAMNILGGGAALGSEFYPPLETVGLPLSMGLGLGAEAIAPSNETQSKKAGGLTHL